jgi:hypothetical protein
MPGVRLLGRPKEYCWVDARRVAEARGRSSAGHGVRPDCGASRWREAWRGARVAEHGAASVAGAKGDAI